MDLHLRYNLLNKNKMIIYSYAGMHDYYNYIKGIIDYGFVDFIYLGEFLKLNIQDEESKKY